MDKREKTWELLAECFNTYSEEVKQELMAINKRADDIKHYRPKHTDKGSPYAIRAADLSEVDEMRKKFWETNHQLMENMDGLVGFLQDEFLFDLNKVDEKKLIEEARHICRGGLNCDSIEEARKHKVSDQLLPLLVVRTAMKDFKLPLAYSTKWKELARFYAPIVMAA